MGMKIVGGRKNRKKLELEKNGGEESWVKLHLIQGCSVPTSMVVIIMKIKKIRIVMSDEPMSAFYKCVKCPMYDM